LIYFVVNNDFHVEHIEYYIKGMQKDNVTIIRIPYSLKSDCRHLTDNIFTFETPFRKKMNFVEKFIKIKHLKKTIERNLFFEPEDKVVILTEYDPLNQFVVYLAKRKDAKVYILQGAASAAFFHFSGS
jgi:hypothetical protein